MRAARAKGEPGTPAYRVALRDAIVSTKELVGTHSVYNFKPADRYGSDERSRVIVKLEKGQWKLVPRPQAGALRVARPPPTGAIPAARQCGFLEFLH